MSNYRRNGDPYWVDCSEPSLKLNAWDNVTPYWNKDVREDINEWPLQKVFKVLCSFSHCLVNKSPETPAVAMFDSYIFSTLAERWTSLQVGGSIRIVNKMISISGSGVKDPDFKNWLVQHELKKRTRNLPSNTMAR